MKNLSSPGGINMKSKILLILNGKSSKESIFDIFSTKHKIFVISLVLGIIITAIVGIYSNNTQKDIAGNLLRLHVIANSDSVEDQQLKLKIRDSIISLMADKFKESNSIEQTKQIALDNIDNMTDVAKDVITKNNKDYNVNIKIANTFFPTKYYGDIALPTGYYDAVRVEIGSAKGANWWCVLFPPLCFVDATNGTLPDGSKERLKASLTPEEYALISNSSSNQNVPVKIKFKTVEIWQQSKHTVEVALEKIF